MKNNLMLINRMEPLLDWMQHGDSHLRPTQIYEEGWLLRIILDWFAHTETPAHALSFAEGATWFSEAMLPSAFPPRFRGDPLSEGRTNADGVIGHFTIGDDGKADLNLTPSATQFMVLEAKLFSPLSKGTTRAPDFDQAARNIACIAEVLHRADRAPAQLDQLAFYVLAPAVQINSGFFATAMQPNSVISKVAARVAGYEGDKDAWHERWFAPLMQQLTIQAISWEAIIAHIETHDAHSAAAISTFYARCLDVN